MTMRDQDSPEFIAAYMQACANRAPDHNENGLSYFRAGWQAATEAAAKKCDGLVYAINNGGNQYRREASASRCAAAIRGKGE